MNEECNCFLSEIETICDNCHKLLFELTLDKKPNTKQVIDFYNKYTHNQRQVIDLWHNLTGVVYFIAQYKLKLDYNNRTLLFSQLVLLQWFHPDYKERNQDNLFGFIDIPLSCQSARLLRSRLVEFIDRQIDGYVENISWGPNAAHSFQSIKKE